MAAPALARTRGGGGVVGGRRSGRERGKEPPEGAAGRSEGARGTSDLARGRSDEARGGSDEARGSSDEARGRSEGERGGRGKGGGCDACGVSEGVCGGEGKRGGGCESARGGGGCEGARGGSEGARGKTCSTGALGSGGGIGAAELVPPGRASIRAKAGGGPASMIVGSAESGPRMGGRRIGGGGGGARPTEGLVAGPSVGYASAVCDAGPELSTTVPEELGPSTMVLVTPAGGSGRGREGRGRSACCERCMAQIRRMSSCPRPSRRRNLTSTPSKGTPSRRG